MKIICSVLIFCLFYYFSFNLVFLDQEEGIFKIKNNIKGYQRIAHEVIKLTEEDAVIIAERNDKVFFPARSVIYKLNNERDKELIARLLDKRSVYWWRFQLTGDDLEYIKQVNSRENYQWFLAKPVFCKENQCLYPLEKLNL